MAQQVVSLAKEETSQNILDEVTNTVAKQATAQSILTKVTGLETSVGQIAPQVAEVNGGYPYVRSLYVELPSSGTKTVTIAGKAKVTIAGINGNSSISNLAIDGVTIGGFYTTIRQTTASDNHDYFTCEESMILNIKLIGSSAALVFIAQFANSNGTLTVS